MDGEEDTVILFKPRRNLPGFATGKAFLVVPLGEAVADFVVFCAGPAALVAMLYKCYDVAGACKHVTSDILGSCKRERWYNAFCADTLTAFAFYNFQQQVATFQEMALPHFNSRQR